ncbi:MAG: hypothetical protein ACXWC4_00710 [Telluria sp.]
MHITKQFAVGAVVIALLSACSAIGPTNSTEFEKLANAPIPSSDGPVHMMGAAQWFPNSRGFTGTRSFALGGGTLPIPGVLVIADKAILFEQWDERAAAFDIVKRIPLDQLMGVQLDSYGRGRQLVVRKKDLSFESFSFTGESGQMVDQEKTEAAVVLLQKRLPQGDSGSPSK